MPTTVTNGVIEYIATFFLCVLCYLLFKPPCPICCGVSQ
jgi:hypothetical protein